MAALGDKAARFLSLHVPGQPLLIPNPWDAGSARILAHMGFQALATTSSGYAGTLGRLDHHVSQGEALTHAAFIVAAVDVPVSADLENGFADSPEGVADTVRWAVDIGLAGCSVEDSTGGRGEPLYDQGLAVDRVRAAAEAAHRDGGLVLTARCEGFFQGVRDLGEIIARLQAYQEAGADVLFAPGVVGAEEIRTVVANVDRPVNVLVLPGAPPVDVLAEAGVARISVGGGFAAAAWAALARAGRELLEQGTYGWMDLAAEGRDVARRALE